MTKPKTLAATLGPGTPIERTDLSDLWIPVFGKVPTGAVCVAFTDEDAAYAQAEAMLEHERSVGIYWVGSCMMDAESWMDERQWANVPGSLRVYDPPGSGLWIVQVTDTKRFHAWAKFESLTKARKRAA